MKELNNIRAIDLEARKRRAHGQRDAPSAMTARAHQTAGVDVKHPLRIVALNASIGRIARLQDLPREGLEYAR
jgi:hypothetical protein